MIVGGVGEGVRARAVDCDASRGRVVWNGS
jgi:hypothetical protein